MRSSKPVAYGLCASILALALAACGSSEKSSSSSTSSSTASAYGPFSTGGYKNPATQSLTCATKGGTLDVLQESDFEHLDPGNSYYALDYPVVYATQSPLFMFKPNSKTEAVPLMASKPAEISEGGKKITVTIREGVKFSPPVNREVTSEDVAYALERGANPNVANPYFQAYFESVEGAAKAEGGPIKGITTPNKHEIVFKLTEPKAAIVIDALSLPLSAPVPKEYAEKYDKQKPSAYYQYEVATGPYMLKADSSGKVLGVGYVPGRSATLVRNPNWKSEAIRPACLNEISIKIGGTNTVIGRQTLEGTDVLESTPPAQTAIREAAEKYKEQLVISPGSGIHYIGLDNKVGPFKNIDLRKALWAALNRTAMNKAAGGQLVTNVATHFIYPGIPGWEQAGGEKGPQVDYNEHPEGDEKLAEEYIKKAGYPSGKYTGGETVTVVGSKGSPAEQDAEIVNSTLKELGFNTKFSLPETSTMYAKYCNVPKEEISVCPNVGWIADFADGQAMLNVTFNGKFIPTTGNVNWSQTDVPAINEAMTKAEDIVGKEERAKAWGAIDVKLVEDATAVPWEWGKQPNIEGKGVDGVADYWNQGSFDYSYTSLK